MMITDQSNCIYGCKLTIYKVGKHADLGTHAIPDHVTHTRRIHTSSSFIELHLSFASPPYPPSSFTTVANRQRIVAIPQVERTQTTQLVGRLGSYAIAPCFHISLHHGRSLPIPRTIFILVAFALNVVHITTIHSSYFRFRTFAAYRL